MASKYPSRDKRKFLRLCRKDQSQANSCPNCNDLHLCRDFLFESRCSTFQSHGKCSHPHSLWTQHNAKVLEEFKLNPNHADVFPQVISLIQLSDRHKHHPGVPKHGSPPIETPIGYSASKNASRFIYIFDKPFKPYEIAYLFGPARDQLFKSDRTNILTSGYCRITNRDQEKLIRNQLYHLLPRELFVKHVEYSNPVYQLLVSTSAGQRILEQNQETYAVFSKRHQSRFKIQVLNWPFSRRPHSSHPELGSNQSRIDRTTGAIDVIRGDITQTKVDMLVCVATSATLLNSVFRAAGLDIVSEYQRRYRGLFPFILDGGSTEAKKILFINWEMSVLASDTDKTTKSLSTLVCQSIEQAFRVGMKSIAFPSIGTGKIGLSPKLVSKTMIDAATKCLQEYPIDVHFVMPSSTEPQHNELYLTFQAYLNESRKDHHSSDSLDTKMTPKTLVIHRTVPSEKPIIVSDRGSLDGIAQHLHDSFKRIIVNKTLNLKQIPSYFLERIDTLIDHCLQYHVLPTIDYAIDKLEITGDAESCAQCLANVLSGKRNIHHYKLCNGTRSHKTDETQLNAHVSMKIDEAFLLGEANICVDDGNGSTLDIDLNNFEVTINAHRAILRKTEIRQTAMMPPLTWSSSALMVRIIDNSLSSFSSPEFIRVFEKTMLPSDWRIEEIKTIENWPLYCHFTLNGSEDEHFAFHACSVTSVSSVIHYGLQSNTNDSKRRSVGVSQDALTSHIHGARRSINGKYYMFVLGCSKDLFKNFNGYLSNENCHLVLPKYLIIYERRNELSQS